MYCLNHNYSAVAVTVHVEHYFFMFSDALFGLLRVLIGKAFTNLLPVKNEKNISSKMHYLEIMKL